MLKISESTDNPNRLLFRCPKGCCHFFEWWNLEDDEKQLSGNKWDTSYFNDQRSENDSRPYANDQMRYNDRDLILLRHLVELQSSTIGSNGSNDKILYANFLILLVIVVLVIFK